MRSTRWVTDRYRQYCRRPDAVVTWIGPVHHNGACAPMHACQPRLDILADQVQAHTAAGDTTPVRAH